MKYFVVVVVLVSIAVVNASVFDKFGETQRKKLQDITATCTEQESTTKSEVGRLLKGNFDDSYDEHTKCFTNCFMVKTGWFIDGVVKEEAISEAFSPVFGEPHVRAVMEKCRGVTGVDKCDSAFQVYQCCYTTHRKLQAEMKA